MYEDMYELVSIAPKKSGGKGEAPLARCKSWSEVNARPIALSSPLDGFVYVGIV